MKSSLARIQQINVINSATLTRHTCQCLTCLQHIAGKHSISLFAHLECPYRMCYAGTFIPCLVCHFFFQNVSIDHMAGSHFLGSLVLFLGSSQIDSLMWSLEVFYLGDYHDSLSPAL